MKSPFKPKPKPEKSASYKAARKTTATRERRTMTVSQKAEAAALWRAGGHTLSELSKKFSKRPEALSLLFKRMGAVKGATAVEAVEKAEKTLEAVIVSAAEENIKKIQATKEEHYRMSTGMAKLAWSELVKARQAGVDIAGLKDLMVTLKMAGDVIGNARKELFAILNVDKHDASADFQDLPELTVRELTGNELGQLRAQSVTDDDLENDPGLSLPPEPFPEVP